MFAEEYGYKKINMTKPIVSIIIPHFNRTILLKDTLNSIKNQTFQHWEVIVVDDLSNNVEWEQLKTFEENKIKIIQRAEGLKGPSSCRNLGVKSASGKYLIFLDSDDLLESFCVEQRIAEIEKDPKIVMAIFKIMEFFKIPGDSNKIYNTDFPLNTITGQFIEGNNAWNVTCPIWNKNFFYKLGGFDESLLFMEDPELHIRALIHSKNEIKICYNKPADCYYRINYFDDSKQLFWYNSILYKINFFKKILKLIIDFNLQPEMKAHIRKGILTLLKNFLFHRKNEFPELYESFKQLLKNSSVFSNFEIIWINYLVDTGYSKNYILQKLKIKGISYSLLPGK